MQPETVPVLAMETDIETDSMIVEGHTHAEMKAGDMRKTDTEIAETMTKRTGIIHLRNFAERIGEVIDSRTIAEIEIEIEIDTNTAVEAGLQPEP